MEIIVKHLQAHPELTFFLTLGLGYLIGKIKILGMPLGAVTGVLIAGVGVGQLKIAIGAEFKSALLLLFLFSIGYKVGPQFFKGLKSTGLVQAALTAVLCVTGLIVVYIFAKMFNLDPGTAGGLIGGALTESATLGSASEALSKLDISPEKLKELTGNATVAFAVTYFLGVLAVVFYLSRLGPKILGVDIAEECRKLEEEMGSKEENPAVYMAYQEISVRAYRVPEGLHKTKVSDLEKQFLPNRVFVDRIRRGKELLLGNSLQEVLTGDVLALSGRTFVFSDAKSPLKGLEVEDRELLDYSGETLEVIVTNKALDQQTIEDLAKRVDARGVFLLSIKRFGQDVPIMPKTKIEVGDTLEMTGARWHVERVAAQVGFAIRPSESSEMVSVMAAILFGAIIGLPAVLVSGVQIGLSLAVGVLVGGLIVGWLHSTRPQLGQIPKPALWIFDSLGLCGFLAITAIGAGPDFVRGLQESGLMLVGLGIVTVIIPHTVTLLLGKYVFKIHPGILLGICAGAGTSAPALAAIQEVAKSKIPTLGYGVTYAIGNVLLALWGSVIVVLLA
ncbi:aspartate-alanine antiporter [Bdellovibrio sp. HCB2-146]|uniref:aspartate-alanine antiporter n=1 Tax=Bdellovibrio sp. HCB2-146 TaxID=3394362 RepID=UPI0039BC66D8